MFQDGFPYFLRDDVNRAVELILHITYRNVNIGASQDKIQYYQDNNIISFPYRIYYIDIPDKVLQNLSVRQKMILHCIYSRSCDGFVRQKHMYSLLQMDFEDWTIPYIVKICDEYIVEILEMNYAILKERNTELIKKFCFENIELFCKSYSRMISYWNEYYRCKYKNFQQYIGRNLFRECFGYSNSMERKRTGVCKNNTF